MAIPRGLLLVVLVILLATLLWQEASSSATASPTVVPPSPPQGLLEEVSQPTIHHLQVLHQEEYVAALGPYPEGTWLLFEAHIQETLTWVGKIYVDECVGTQSQYLNHSQRMYSLIFSHGCLSVSPQSNPWSRKGNSLLFSVKTFMLNDDVEEEEVYIICWNSVWSWMKPYEPGRKSCFYNTSSNSWQLADDKGKSSVCDCCASACFAPKDKEFPGEGESQKMVIGPMKIRKSQSVSWLRASCRTVKDLLVATLAFTCVTVLLTLFLLTLRSHFWIWLSWFPCSLWRRLREHPSDLEVQEMRSVTREGSRFGEENEGEHGSTSEEDVETVQ